MIPHSILPENKYPFNYWYDKNNAHVFRVSNSIINWWIKGNLYLKRDDFAECLLISSFLRSLPVLIEWRKTFFYVAINFKCPGWKGEREHSFSKVWNMIYFFDLFCRICGWKKKWSNYVRLTFKTSQNNLFRTIFNLSIII